MLNDRMVCGCDAWWNESRVFYRQIRRVNSGRAQVTLKTGCLDPGRDYTRRILPIVLGWKCD